MVFKTSEKKNSENIKLKQQKTTILRKFQEKIFHIFSQRSTQTVRCLSEYLFLDHKCLPHRFRRFLHALGGFQAIWGFQILWVRNITRKFIEKLVLKITSIQKRADSVRKAYLDPIRNCEHGGAGKIEKETLLWPKIPKQEHYFSVFGWDIFLQFSDTKISQEKNLTNFLSVLNWSLSMWERVLVPIYHSFIM